MEGSQLQTAPPEHEIRGYEKAVVSPEHENDQTVGPLDRVFAGAPDDGGNGNAARLLRSPWLSYSANGPVRAIAFKRTQQTRGNHFAERIIQGIQYNPTTSRIAQLNSPKSEEKEIVPSDSPGHSLDPSTQDFMGPRFDMDFKYERVRTDSPAAQAADVSQPDAYTTRRDTYFDAGSYASATREDEQVLAGELPPKIHPSGGNETQKEPETKAPLSVPSTEKDSPSPFPGVLSKLDQPATESPKAQPALSSQLQQAKQYAKNAGDEHKQGQVPAPSRNGDRGTPAALTAGFVAATALNGSTASPLGAGKPGQGTAGTGVSQGAKPGEKDSGAAIAPAIVPSGARGAGIPPESREDGTEPVSRVPAGGNAPRAHTSGRGAGHAASGKDAGSGASHGGHAPQAKGEPVGAAGGGTPASHLDAWKASVAARTSEIQDPQLGGSAAAPGNLAKHAQSVAQQRQSERPDYLKDARDRMPAAPQEPPRENILDTQPADAAITSLEAVGAAKLPDQTFPAMLPLPPYAGAPAGGGAAGPAAVVVPPAPAADAKPGAPAPGAGVPADANADGVKAKVAAVAPTTGSAASGQAFSLQDKGAASLAPLPPAQATEIGDVVARVLQDVSKYAKEIVDTAAAQLDPSKKVAALAQLTDPLVAKQQDELTTELNGVAAAAGISADQLAAKVEKQKADAVAKTEKAAIELDAKSTQAKADVQTRGTEETAAISGACSAVADEVDRKQQAAKGEPDAAAIDAKRDSYIEKVNSISAAGLARYRASTEQRAADLDRVGSEQKAAYKQRSQAEAERIKALFPDELIKGKIESRPVLDWGDQQVLEVEGTVARLKREATTASAELQKPLTVAAQTARDRIRDWAASKKGTQRSWWDQLRDLFTDWMSKAKADNKAWETQRNAETRDKVAGDFDMLVRLRDEMAAGNQEAFQAEMSRLSKEQRAVVMAFIKSGGKDSIGAVAIGLIEQIKAHRVPELSKALEEKAIAELGWKDLNLLGGEQSPGFDAGLIVRDVRRSVKGWGTDEKLLFKALQGRTPIQVAALRRAYAAAYPGHDMDDDIKEDLSGTEMERAEAYLSGDKTAGAIATLHDAMSGAGTDEELIMETLRGKTPAERDAITAAYKEKYGVELKTDLEDEMSGNDLDQANALVAGDATKADAIAINEAMDGVGTDEKGINAVYSRIRDEVEADAKRKGMTTAEVNAEIQRRTGALKSAYGAKYAGGDPNQMEADFRDELSGGELNVVLAEQVNDQTAMDAAKIQIEHESLYTDDDKVNAVLIAQHDRAKKEVMRDLEVDFTKKSAQMTPEERKNAREQMEKQAEGPIAERSKQNMAALKDRYDAENPEFGFQAVMDIELQGYSHDEALERIEAGGKLDDAHEIKYSIFGLGTNEERIKETLKGKSKTQIEKIKNDYKTLTGNDLAEDIAGDMAGRDLADTTFMLDGTSTPEEKMAYLQKRKEWEVSEGTGLVGEAVDNEEEDVLERTVASAQIAYDKYLKLRKDKGENDPETQAALEEFERWSGYGDKDIEEHRAALDSITDTVAAGVAIVAGIAVTVLTAGAAGPAVAAAVGTIAATFGTSTAVVAAAAGAIAATAASMATKELMKGGAYDLEAIAVDMAQGTVEAMVAVATAGTGEAALKALLKTPAFAALTEAAESGALSKIVTKSVEGGIEGAVMGLPSGMAGAILNENTWKSDNPFAVIMRAGGHGSLQGAGMGAAMGAAMGVKETFGSKGHAGGSRSEGEGAHGGAAEDHAGAHGDSAAPASDHASTSAETNAPAEIDAPIGVDEGEHGTRAADEGGTHGPAADEPAPTSDREPQAPRATDEPTVAGPDEPHAPDTERTIVDDVFDLMPEETVMQGPNPKDPADARLMYENSIAESPNREAAIYRNVETGEYIVIQGDEGTVSVGGGEAPHKGGQPQSWKEILDGIDVGRWELQAHSHPVEATGVVDPVNQWPSGANGDMGGIVQEALASGEARSSRIDYTTADGPNHTDFGFDPAHEKPYWVEVPDGAGGRRTERFKTMEGYHDFIENQVGAPSQGDIPSHMSGTNPTATGAKPVAPAAAKDAPISEAEVRYRIDEIRDKYRDSARDSKAMENALEQLEKMAKKDPAAAAEALDAFEHRASARDVESAFVEAGKAATKAEKATAFEPGEEPPEGLTETDQMNRRLRATRASAELEAAMARQGDPCPPGHDTHHIVANIDPRAAVARRILRDAGINPRNAPENGIHLPRNTMDPTIIPDAATRHQTIHTDAYYEELTLRLIEGKINGTVPETLAQIKAEISDGKFMNASKEGAKKGENFATWLLEHSTKFEWLTPAEIDAVIEGATRRPPVLEADVVSRIDDIREKYRGSASDTEAMENALKRLEKMAKKNPASAAKALDAFEHQAPARDVESAFNEASKWATEAENATGLEPSEVTPND